MARRTITFFFLFLLFLSFSISSDSQNHNPLTNSVNPEQAHEDTIKEDRSINIYRAGQGGHGISGGRGAGRGRKPAQKRNAAMEHRPTLFFSAVSVLFTGFIMRSLTSL